jgi:putative transposase
MAKPLSTDLRERAISRVEAGGSVRAVAASLSISPSCVVKWISGDGQRRAGKDGLS